MIKLIDSISIDNPYKYKANRIEVRSDGLYEFHYVDDIHRSEAIRLIRSMGLKVVGKFSNPEGYENKVGLLIKE